MLPDYSLQHGYTASGISVLIPTYEMGGIGAIMLKRALHSIENQVMSSSIKIEVVVSDHSLDDSIFREVSNFSGSSVFRLTYVRNHKDRGLSSANLNRAFKESKEEIIKILFQDDYLSHEESLIKIISAFDSLDVSWLACGSTQSSDGKVFTGNLVPRFHSQIHRGKNTMSSPSTIALRRNAWIDFDKKLLYLMDVDFYKRMYMRHGLPKIIPNVLIVNGLGPHQVTHTRVSRTRIILETMYVISKNLGRNLRTTYESTNIL